MVKHESLDWMLLGTGMMGEILPHGNEFAGGRVKVVLSQTHEMVDTFLKNNRLPDVIGGGTFEIYQALLSMNPSLVDGVIVATPNFMHANMTVNAADAGYHVFCEKPMATSVEDAERMRDVVLENNVAFQLNSHYRFHELMNGTLKTAIKTGKIGGLDLGKVVEYGSGYIQGWNGPQPIDIENPIDDLVIPSTDIAWRADILQAGKGKGTGDLGPHILMMLYNLFDSTDIRDFEGQRYNLFPQRWEWAGPKAKTFEVVERPTPYQDSSKWTRVDMLGPTRSGDDRSSAKAKLHFGDGQEIPVNFYISQVDEANLAGKANANNFYVQVEFKNGRVYWNQEKPDLLYIQMGSKRENRNPIIIDRHSNPSLTGRPGGHPHGYDNAEQLTFHEMMRAIESGDQAQIRAYSERNLAHGVASTKIVGLWNGPKLIEDVSGEKSRYIARHQENMIGR